MSKAPAKKRATKKRAARAGRGGGAATKKRPAGAVRAGAAVTLSLPLTKDEAERFDRMGREEFDCYPVFSSMADVVRHSLLLSLVSSREYADREDGATPEYDALLSACPASGCSCPVESTRDGQIWRQCAAAGEPCWSAGRPA